MISIGLKRRAIKAYPRTPYCDIVGIKYMRLKWIDNILLLGDKHILHISNGIKRPQS